MARRIANDHLNASTLYHSNAIHSKVTIFIKPNCPLCDEALEQIELARRQKAFELKEINILSDLSTYERYKHFIPVVMLDGEETFRFRLTAEALLLRLQTLQP